MNSGGLAENGVTLGNEEYFVLGDNRNNSEDSRFTDVGNIPARAVMGKVWLIVSPLSSFGFIEGLAHCLSAVFIRIHRLVTESSVCIFNTFDRISNIKREALNCE